MQGVAIWRYSNSLVWKSLTWKHSSKHLHINQKWQWKWKCHCPLHTHLSIYMEQSPANVEWKANVRAPARCVVASIWQKPLHGLKKNNSFMCVNAINRDRASKCYLNKCILCFILLTNFPCSFLPTNWDFFGWIKKRIWFFCPVTKDSWKVQYTNWTQKLDFIFNKLLPLWLFYTFHNNDYSIKEEDNGNVNVSVGVFSVILLNLWLIA